MTVTLAAATASCFHVALGDTVYQNINLLPKSDSVAGKEYGDEITLAGINRLIDKFTLAYFAEIGNSPKAAAVVTIYAKDGPQTIPGSTTSQRPSTVLWQSDPFAIVDGVHGLDLAPNILVPDTIIWTIKFTGLTDGSPDVAGLLMADTPTVGGTLPGKFQPVIGSYEDFWVKNDSTRDDSWALNHFGTAVNPLGNFYALVDAVPEPTTVALSTIVAALVFSGAMKRKR